MGLCFGVRDALKATRAIERPERVTIHGELVHNERVLHDLARRGFRVLPEGDREAMPTTPEVLITAHGVSDRERARLRAGGKRLLDTTCPLVVRVHEAARRLERDEGRYVLVIGRRGHVEVRGIVGDLRGFEVLERVEDVRPFPHPRLGIVCQTTTTMREADAIVRRVRQCNPDADIRFVDTVCQPTRDRQRALDELLDEVEAVVVVGGRRSNNTRRLVARCLERGTPALHVQSPSDLDSDWFSGFRTVGLTAGTSTPDEIIEAVHRAMLSIARRIA
jgi:4-hydroxy-3-methylbut-2-enyl diphosphate reductase